ncbi:MULTISPECIES: S-methyl-5-thioribose-1-phosphate isomerase [unclassified Sphingomonas]|uniref:S-methyl-5-thioribose-1-phosphate isomerase n=1 Tax=unclassified Sphingomonas TaxID=196159 RepID=UPI000BDB69D1|nr:MAG: S-methyl-5-thioribose-1-phosphate isomerase [Sphingomonas sp. 12-62-6]OYX38462.1 MAG: S-methyl-5-thioribose-1-phosphate isomerase [Sphingomonas sp. 32-62-10]
MKLNGTHTRSIMRTDDGAGARILDQRDLPWKVTWVELRDAATAERAIREMWTRGAPLIGATAAYGLAMALAEDPSDAGLASAHKFLLEARPTAVNLRWALDDVAAHVRPLPVAERAQAAFARADQIADDDAAMSEAIGAHGLDILRDLHAQHPDRPLNILTHCNAGWLATVDYGTATAPIYMAHDAGIPVHVWVDETRPRNQGALLTAFELASHGVPHTVIVDNAGGHLMMNGQVDMVIVGTDRVAANGDVCNKIGTYLKALAAKDNNIPFYVALPSTTFDATTPTGADVPIEERSGEEVTHVQGEGGAIKVTASGAANPAFDVTPARLVTGYITEKGVSATI